MKNRSVHSHVDLYVVVDTFKVSGLRIQPMSEWLTEHHYSKNIFVGSEIQIKLAGYNLANLSFKQAVLQEMSDLSRTNLTRACFASAILTKVDLSFSDLSRADLTHANLIKTNLEQASLIRAKLEHTNLTDATGLTGFQLSKAKLYPSTRADDEANKTIIKGAFELQKRFRTEKNKYNTFQVVKKFTFRRKKNDSSEKSILSIKDSPSLTAEEVKQYCAIHGLNGFKSTINDGDCFFRAILLAIDREEDEHIHLRRLVVKYIQDHRDNFPPDSYEINNKKVTFDEYIRYIAKEGNFVEGLVLQATATVLKTQINVKDLKKNADDTVSNFFEQIIAVTYPEQIVDLVRVDGKYYHAIINKACRETEEILPDNHRSASYHFYAPVNIQGSFVDKVEESIIKKVKLQTAPQSFILSRKRRSMLKQARSIFHTPTDFLIYQQQDNLTIAQKFALNRYRNKLVTAFLSNPSQANTQTLVQLALTQNKRQCQNLLRNYLTFLRKNISVEMYHIQGLVDILTLAQGKVGNNVKQIKQVLEELSFKILSFSNDELSSKKYLTNIQVWRQILEYIWVNNIAVDKIFHKSLASILKECHEFFKELNDEESANVIGWIKQINKCSETKSILPDGLKAGLYILSAVEYLADAAEIAATKMKMMNLCNIDTIKSAFVDLKNITQKGEFLGRWMKGELQKKNWFDFVQEQQLTLIYHTAVAANWVPEQDDDFQGLIQFCEQLQMIRDKSLQWHLGQELLNTIMRLSLGLKKTHMQTIQKLFFQLLMYYFREVTEPGLRSRLFCALMQLTHQLEEFTGVVYCLTILSNAPEVLEALTWDEALQNTWGLLYCWLESQISKNQQNEISNVRNYQQAILDLFIRQFSKRTESEQEHILQLLYCLNNYPMIQNRFLIKTAIKTILAETYAIDELEREAYFGSITLTEIRVRIKAYFDQYLTPAPPLAEIAWCLLEEDQQYVLLENIFNTNEISSPLTTSTTQIPYLFGHVHHAIVGLIKEGGITIALRDKNGVEANTAFLNETDLIDTFRTTLFQAATNQEGQQKSNMTQISLAKDTDFLFLGAYCKGGVVIGDDTMVNAAFDTALNLAKEYREQLTKEFIVQHSTNYNDNSRVSTNRRPRTSPRLFEQTISQETIGINNEPPQSFPLNFGKQG